MPRLINVLCGRLLLFCYLESTGSIDWASVRTVAEETGICAPAGVGKRPEQPVRQPTPSSPSRSEAGTGDVGLALISELNERLRSVESRIQYTERRLHIELIRLRKLIVALGGTDEAINNHGRGPTALLRSSASW